MTKISAFVQVCKATFAAGAMRPTHAVMGVAMSDKTEVDLLRCGQTSAAILHSKFSGLHYA